MRRLKAGEAAPEFTAVTHNGGRIQLSSFRDRQVWLIFYRYASCPLCNLHLSQVLDSEEKLKEAGLQVIAVFESPSEKFPQHIGKRREPSIPLVCDPAKEIYRLYDTEVRGTAVIHPAVTYTLLKAMFYGFPQGKIEGELGQIPAHFLITERGIIDKIHYGKHIADHLTFSEVDAFLKRRKTTGRAA